MTLDCRRTQLLQMRRLDGRFLASQCLSSTPSPWKVSQRTSRVWYSSEQSAGQRLQSEAFHLQLILQDLVVVRSLGRCTFRLMQYDSSTYTRRFRVPGTSGL